MLLAIDNGTQHLGWAAYGHLKYHSSGVIRATQADAYERMRALHIALDQLILSDDLMADGQIMAVIETPMIHKSARSGLLLAQMVGVCSAVIWHAGGTVKYLDPNQWQHEALGIAMNATTEIRKAASIATAQRLIGKTMTADEADAVLMGHVVASRLRMGGQITRLRGGGRGGRPARKGNSRSHSRSTG